MRGQLFCVLIFIIVVLAAVPYIAIFPQEASRHHKYDETPYDNIIPGVDSDGDGLGDDTEKGVGTDPMNPDTDSDGLGDGVEYDFWKSKKAEVQNGIPVWAQERYPDEKAKDIIERFGPMGDLDNDGLINILDIDSDGDGLSDGTEINMGTDPADPDSDNDGVDDGKEVEEGTNPMGGEDEDDDKMPDDWEEHHDVDDPNADPDHDGDTNLEEYLNGTDPNQPGDGMNSMGEVPPSLEDDYYGEAMDRILFFVEPETNPSYWRLGSYDTYDGNGWENSKDDKEEYDGRILDVDPPVFETVNIKTFSIKFWGSSRGFLPTAQNTNLIFNVTFNDTNSSNRLYLDGGGGFSSPSVVLRYQFSHKEFIQSREILMGSTIPTGEEMPHLFSIPENTSSHLADIVPNIPNLQDPPYQRALNIIQYLDETYEYNLSASMDPEKDWAYQFLYEVKKGKCIDFATAFVLLARYVKLPARVVVGFSPGNMENGYRVVREGHRHAWAEVYFNELGWVGFEVTPYNNALDGGTGIDSDGSDPALHTWDGSPADGHGTNHGKEENKTKDSDGDGLSNWEENNLYSTDPLNPDTDSDGLNDSAEVLDNHTNPNNPDTDGDGLNDYDEIYVFDTDPLNPDTDGDGVKDGDEVLTHHTDPLDPDTDDDMLTDLLELKFHHTDPMNNDTDGDGIQDYEEVFWGSDARITNPLNPDSDGDGLDDYDEIYDEKTDPLDPDSDGDGIYDFHEINVNSTDPLNPDTDSDGLRDGCEIYFHGTDPLKGDTDNDGVGDNAELLLGFDPLKKGSGSLALDTDNDGIPDFMEDIMGTENATKDTDGDSINDGAEIFSFFTDPLGNDTDGDGITDVLELFKWFTDPLFVDSDGDGVTDFNETYTFGTNPNIPDSDLDGLLDGVEIFQYGTDPKKKDSDDGRVPDSAEIWNGLNPKIKSDDGSIVDSDNDGLTDAQEIVLSTEPGNFDSDNDGLWDGEEVNTYHTDPNMNDTDGDGLFDMVETMFFHTDPISNDSDGDGLYDIIEILMNHTHPFVNDTDMDGLSDGVESNLFHTDPRHPDTDRDGLWDGLEGNHDTNPRDPDTDGGGALDGVEVHSGDHDPRNPDDDEDLVDSDGDGLNDYAEKNIHGTDPFDFDTDNDTLGDGAEINVYHTEPLINDTDNDTLFDGDEVFIYKTKPLDNDTDDDKLFDGEEVHIYLTNPNKNDTDNDRLTDWDELFIHFTDPLLKDTDNDGLNDSAEIFDYGTNASFNDTDGDVMVDGWEVKYNLDPLNDTDAALDTDLDGLDNLAEFRNGTNPLLNDTDGEGLLDGEEIKTHGTDPLTPDTDGDTLTDWEEIYTYNTNATNPDSDGDNMTDNWEIDHNLNPNNHLDRDLDYDFDNLTNYDEFLLGTHPGLNDTDGDLLLDGEEVNQFGTNPNLADTDGDTLDDYQELMNYRTDPKKNDTDDDKLDDNEEIFTHKTDPLLNDTDDDGLDDHEEIFVHDTSPLLNDTDMDNLTDYQEVITYGTNPQSNDTDGDGLTDWMEIFRYKTYPDDMDTDKGGMDDGTEIALGRNPLNPDDDGPIEDIVTHPTTTTLTSIPNELVKLETNTFIVNGRVTDENAFGLQGVLVEIYLNSSLNLSGKMVGSGASDVNGVFVINCDMPTRLSIGEIYIRARATSKMIDLELYNESWDDGSSVTKLFSPSILSFVRPPDSGTVYQDKKMNGTVFLKDADNIPISGELVSVFWEQTHIGDIVTDSRGYVDFEHIVPHGIGTRSLHANFFGSQYLFGSNSTREVMVSSHGVNITMDPLIDTNPSDTFICGDEIKITGSVFGENLAPVSEGDVKITIKGNEVENVYRMDRPERVTNELGRFNLTYKLREDVWPAGWYEVYVEFLGSDYYHAGAAPTDSDYFYITQKTVFSYTSLETRRNLTGEYAPVFESTLEDITGKGLVGEDIEISFLGGTIYRRTSYDGVFRFEYEIQDTHPLGPIEITLRYRGQNDTDGRQRYMPKTGSGKIVVGSDTSVELDTTLYNVTRGESISITGRILDDLGKPVKRPKDNDSMAEAFKIYIYIGAVEVGNTSIDDDGDFTYTSIVPLTSVKGLNTLKVEFRKTMSGYEASQASMHIYVFARTHISIEYSPALINSSVTKGALIDVKITLVDDTRVPLRQKPIEVEYLDVKENLFTDHFGRVEFSLNFPENEESFVISTEYSGSKMSFYKASSAKKTVSLTPTKGSGESDFSSQSKQMLPILISILIIGGILFYWNRWRKRHLKEMRSLMDDALNLLETTDEIRKVIYTTYINMLDILRKYGFLRKKNQTPMEFCRAVYGAVPALSAKNVYRLTNIFEEARYSEHEFKAGHKAKAMKYFRTVRRGLEREENISKMRS